MTTANQINGEGLVEVNESKMPRGSFEANFTTEGEYIANVYVVNHRVIIARPRELDVGKSPLVSLSTFIQSRFECAGGCQYSSTQYVKFWQFK